MNPESSYEILQNKRWRAITYNWEVLQDYTQRDNLYCLTEWQAAWLLSNMDYMGWATRWENCPCTPQELAALKADLENRLMTCTDIRPYQIETIYNNSQMDNLRRYNNDWDGVNPSSVNPNAPDDFFDGDGSADRVDALCTACSIYVYSYAADWIQRTESDLGLAIVVGFGSALGLVGGSIATLLIAGLYQSTLENLEAFNDQTAIDNVICCMRDGLTSQATTALNFEGSLDSCGFAMDSNEERIRSIIASDLDQLSNFLSFVNALGDAFIFAENNLAICPCGDPVTITVTFDSLSTIEFDVTLENSPGVTILLPGDLQNNIEGNPVPSAKMAYVQSGSFKGINGSVVVELANVMNVTSVTYDYYYFNGAGNNVLNRTAILLDESQQVVDSGSTSANDAPKNVWNTHNPGVSGNNVKYVDCSIGVVHSGNPPEASTRGWIDNIVITGTTV